MRIDTSIIRDYLSGGTDHIGHWIFRSITDDGVLMFERPAEGLEAAVENAARDALAALDGFRPHNAELFRRLFPKWREICENVNVILAVGCPAPYDAMVREHDGEEYIILDLIRLNNYNADIKTLMTPFLTHELAHICIHSDYPPPTDADDYHKTLEYIVFDEGFAHLLAFRDGIECFDFEPIIQKHLFRSLEKLGFAVSETDIENRAALLREANTGDYWNKFGAISGKLYLASHLNDIEAIYNAGPDNMLACILREAITVEDITVENADEFFERHIKYLVDDGIICDDEDIAYFSGDEYRGVIKAHMARETDRHHMVYFGKGEKQIGAAQYNTYQSEDGKCFILDFWVFPEFRGGGTGRACFAALKARAEAEGAAYYEINSEKEASVRFWKSLGFEENGRDEYDMPLFILQ